MRQKKRGRNPPHDPSHHGFARYTPCEPELLREIAQIFRPTDRRDLTSPTGRSPNAHPSTAGAIRQPSTPIGRADLLPRRRARKHRAGAGTSRPGRSVHRDRHSEPAFSPAREHPLPPSPALGLPAPFRRRPDRRPLAPPPRQSRFTAPPRTPPPAQPGASSCRSGTSSQCAAAGIRPSGTPPRMQLHPSPPPLTKTSWRAPSGARRAGLPPQSVRPRPHTRPPSPPAQAPEKFRAGTGSG